ncbi:unnamed protein product [Penicillium olsonii]|uniref:Uncharacterized protein n=1 Tax=Penicillium olsonii TaxID=99116 RepID=A0A9W4HNX9_PENOL|nr:unnamed protein product [Penicillium olsonii]CAG8079393.1 unnamed protein product [Penicillium olsonii]
MGGKVSRPPRSVANLIQTVYAAQGDLREIVSLILPCNQSLRWHCEASLISTPNLLTPTKLQGEDVTN